MSRTFPIVPLSKLIRRKKDETIIQDLKTYCRLTIHLNGEGISIRDRVLGSEIGTKRQFIVKAGQLVLSKIDARNGAFGIVPTEGDGAIITGNFWAFDVDQALLDVKFFDYLTKTRLFIDFCKKASDGTTNRRYLQEEKFLTQRIELPPIEEQRRIVAQIEELAAKIEEAGGLRREVCDDCEEFCRSILSDAGDGASTLTPMRDLVKLRALDITVSPEEVYPFAGIYSFGKGLFLGQRKHGTEFSYTRLTRLKSDNFVYPKLMAWEGAFAVVRPEYEGLVVSPEFPVFEIDQQRVLPETLEVYFHIPSVWSAVSGASTGTNVRRRRLNPADFLAFEIPLPPMKTQIRLREVKAKLDQMKPLQSETSAELDALLPSILDKAFKGEL